MAVRMMDLLTAASDELRYEPTARRVRADDVVDSTRALLVWEPRRIVPSYAVPEADVRVELVEATGSAPDPGGVLHPGIPFAVHTALGTPVDVGGRRGAGFRLDELPSYVALDTAAFEAWFEDDEQVHGHPRTPFSRIDVRRTSRPVRVELDGQVLAASTQARLLYETGIPTRHYLPREDVRVELTPSTFTTYCPYKGAASYWDVGEHRNLAWSYEDPLPDGPLVQGLVAFWDEKVDVFVDGQRVGPPRGAVVDSMTEEFGL